MPQRRRRHWQRQRRQQQRRAGGTQERPRKRYESRERQWQISTGKSSRHDLGAGRGGGGGLQSGVLQGRRSGDEEPPARRGWPSSRPSLTPSLPPSAMPSARCLAPPRPAASRLVTPACPGRRVRLGRPAGCLARPGGAQQGAADQPKDAQPLSLQTPLTRSRAHTHARRWVTVCCGAAG